MGHLIDQYHSLTCDGRTGNLVQPQCTTRSEGGWNYELMVKEAEKLGWVQKGKQAFCPAHAPASPEPVAAEVRAGRKSSPKADPAPVESSPWTDQPS